ncbi:MAG: hypothetical protein AAF544_09310 [Bacteroidota bacterium]
MRRFAGPQVRAAGTVCGNIASFQHQSLIS